MRKKGFSFISGACKGFSFVELLVTMAIMGILSSIAVFSFTKAPKQARDTQRKSDLKQYQISLETYANQNNGLYPSYTTNVQVSVTLCAKLSLLNCPEDPQNSSSGWIYVFVTPDGSGNGNADATKYSVWSKVETVSSGYTQTPNTRWVFCSNGKSGYKEYPFGTTDCPL